MIRLAFAILPLAVALQPLPAAAQAGWAGDGGRPWILRPHPDERVSGDVRVKIRPLGVGARVRVLAWDTSGGGERELSGGGLGRTRNANDDLTIPRSVFRGVSRATVMVCRRGADRTDRVGCSRPVQFELAEPTAAAPGPSGSIRSLRIEAASGGGLSVRIAGSGVCDELELTSCHRVAGSEVCTRERHAGYDLEGSPALPAGGSMPGLASIAAAPGPGAASCSGRAAADVP